MSDVFSEAISSDDSAPEPDTPHHRLLGDPATEGNEHLDLTDDDDESDDLHEPLNNSDVQN